MLQFVQPLRLATPTLPAGAPFNICSLKCTRGKINRGGTEFPSAFTVEIIVIFYPKSCYQFIYFPLVQEYELENEQ